MPRHYSLVDACVAAAHFAPKTTQSAKLKARSTAVFTGHSQHCDVRLLIPNFCIGEVFAVFEKYRWGRTWNKHVKPANTLTTAEFTTARKTFHDAIHNGATVLQVELNRYHILCIDLVAPVNNAYKIVRSRGTKKNPTPASTFDMQLVAMGIWVKRLFGDADFTVVTGDERIATVGRRARSVNLGQPMKAHLSAVAKQLGLTYGPTLYPEVINLTRCRKQDLDARFPGWSVPW